MSKKFLFLTFFVLVLGFAGASRAAMQPIDVNNYSFELAPDGNRVPGHSGYDGVLAWKENAGGAAGWVGVDVMCPYANSTHCHRWPGPTEDGSGNDVVYSYIQHTGANAYQVLDMNNSDANAIIALGRQYTLIYDALGWDGDEHAASLFYPEDLALPDEGHMEIASKTYALEYIARPLGDCAGESALDDPDECPDWTRNLKLVFVAEAGGLYLGKTLGVKITALSPGGYTFVDNVRLYWDYATYAYDPYPADKAEDVERNVTLRWKPGTYTQDVNGHEVYFGTSFDEVNDANTSSSPDVFRGAQDVNYYTPSEVPLDLGKTYYWRVDEVNDSYVYDGNGPPTGPWKGDVWSFTVTGYAYNIYPPDGAEDIPYLGLELSWAAGTEATSHDVYFGSTYEAVDEANNSDPIGPPGAFRGNQVLADVNYLVPDSLLAGRTYYWRIDERSPGPVLLKGKVWSFTTGTFLVVEDFDSYASKVELWNVWHDVYTGGVNGYVYLETGVPDANLVHDGNSMKYEYINNAKGNTDRYSETWANATELNAGTDWTAGGVKALVMYFYGLTSNTLTATDKLYMALSDGTHTGVVTYDGDMNNLKDASWHEWNIDLNDPCLASVNKSSISKLYLGVGKRGLQSATKGGIGAVYFDDIRLYPPRCLLDRVPAGAADFTYDCTVDAFDLDIMATDWLMSETYTLPQDGHITMAAGNPMWITGYIGPGALAFDPNIEVDVNDPRLAGLNNMTISAWVKRNGEQSWVGMVTSREGGSNSELAFGGGGFGGPGANKVAYCWNEIGDTWKFDSGLVVPDNTWTFVAFSADPTGATLYMRPAGGTLTSKRHVITLPPLNTFAQYFWIGRGMLADRYLKGALDDVRIYNRNLDAANIAMLANQTGEPTPGPVYRYRLDETSGLVVDDSGDGAILSPPSPANLIDPEVEGSRSVNFRDYAILADQWLEKFLWP